MKRLICYMAMLAMMIPSAHAGMGFVGGGGSATSGAYVLIAGSTMTGVLTVSTITLPNPAGTACIYSMTNGLNISSHCSTTGTYSMLVRNTTTGAGKVGVGGRIGTDLPDTNLHVFGGAKFDTGFTENLVINGTTGGGGYVLSNGPMYLRPATGNYIYVSTNTSFVNANRVAMGQTASYFYDTAEITQSSMSAKELLVKTTMYFTDGTATGAQWSRMYFKNPGGAGNTQRWTHHKDLYIMHENGDNTYGDNSATNGIYFGYSNGDSNTGDENTTGMYENFGVKTASFSVTAMQDVLGGPLSGVDATAYFMITPGTVSVYIDGGVTTTRIKLRNNSSQLNINNNTIDVNAATVFEQGYGWVLASTGSVTAAGEVLGEGFRFRDGSYQNTAVSVGSALSDERYVPMLTGGDIFASSGTFDAVPDLVGFIPDSFTVVGIMAQQLIPSAVFPSEFNVAFSTWNDVGAAARSTTYFLDKAISLAVNVSSSPWVSISTYVPGGTWIAVHVTTCATSGTLPRGYGATLKLQRK